MQDVTGGGVLRAVGEYRGLGREQFLGKYGFGPARRYYLVHEEGWYESKAIVGAAHGFDRPDLGPLRADEFSGGVATVGSLLERLGFTVIADVPNHQMVDGDGSRLDASFELAGQGKQWSVTLQSRGGTVGSPNARNTEYAQGLKLLLKRMKAQSAVIATITVDSDRVHQFPPSERQLDLPFPLTLSGTAMPALADRIGSAQAKILREPGAKGSGNRTRRIRIEVALPREMSRPGFTSILKGGPAESVGVFVLTWNPERFRVPEEEIRSQSALTMEGIEVPDRWSTGPRNSGITPGDRVLLFCLGPDRGIVRAGVATSEITQEPHWDGTQGEHTNYALVAWSAVVPSSDRLPVETLRAASNHTDWDAVLDAGIQLPPDDAATVWKRWTDHWQVIRSAHEALPGDEAELANDPAKDLVTEGAKKSVLVNRYERNPEGRRRCIEKHGCVCAACGINFGETYGPIGEGFIHVHHTVPLAHVGETYELDPDTELVPVCPNCHAMLHRGVTTPRTVDELRILLAAGLAANPT